MNDFPSDFLWGAATSAYQVEGNNTNADWWHWELKNPRITASGNACLHYQKYKEDFDIAKQLNHNCHRFSIEWSRVNPQPEKFSDQQIQHYYDCVSYLRTLNIEPIITLHHFTNPLWFSQQGGWNCSDSVRYYLLYVEKILQALAEKVRYWVTINEPMVYVYYAFIAGRWPPQQRSVIKANKVLSNLIKAHIKAYEFIHNYYRQKKLPSPLVSIAHNMVAFVPCNNNLRNKFMSAFRHYMFNLKILNELVGRKKLDFLGLNYYTRHLIDVQSWSIKEWLNNQCAQGHNTLEKNSMGWEIYPQGLLNILLSLKRYNLPIIILENGICTLDDRQRWRYIYNHLKQVSEAIKRAVPVKGYLYWSLIDNFEWDYGFEPRFGLCAVDYSSYQRTIRESAYAYARICKTGLLIDEAG
ncbi:MAG: glycoside hydrolase family 1 protein [Candidatus Omnitrophica bacterium]|nr:glycoside hydrolase family 1 protein [Candidatus Omnitrophota bacterium]